MKSAKLIDFSTFTPNFFIEKYRLNVTINAYTIFVATIFVVTFYVLSLPHGQDRTGPAP